MRGHGGCENLETGKSTNECSRVALSPIQSECSVRLKPIHVNGGEVWIIFQIYPRIHMYIYTEFTLNYRFDLDKVVDANFFVNRSKKFYTQIHTILFSQMMVRSPKHKTKIGK